MAEAGDTESAHAGLTLNLAGDDEHGNGIGPGAEDAIERIDAAGTGRNVDDAGAACDAGVGLGGHRGSLLVMIADVLDARLVANGVIEVHGSAAGDEKDVAHAPIGELTGDVVGELHGRRSLAGSRVAANTASVNEVAGRLGMSSSGREDLVLLRLRGGGFTCKPGFGSTNGLAEWYLYLKTKLLARPGGRGHIAVGGCGRRES